MAFTLPFLVWDCSGCYMTTKWKSGKRSVQLTWQVSTHCIDLQCPALWWQEGSDQSACTLELFLEGPVMTRHPQVLCSARGACTGMWRHRSAETGQPSCLEALRLSMGGTAATQSSPPLTLFPFCFLFIWNKKKQWLSWCNTEWVNILIRWAALSLNCWVFPGGWLINDLKEIVLEFLRPLGEIYCFPSGHQNHLWGLWL